MFASFLLSNLFFVSFALMSPIGMSLRAGMLSSVASLRGAQRTCVLLDWHHRPSTLFRWLCVFCVFVSSPSGYTPAPRLTS